MWYSYSTVVLLGQDFREPESENDSSSQGFTVYVLGRTVHLTNGLWLQPYRLQVPVDESDGLHDVDYSMFVRYS